MKKWTLVDRAVTPDGRSLTLHEHDGSRSIRVDNAELMSTRQHESEELLARAACAHLKGKSGAAVLIGGLGFGFTLRAALAGLAEDASVTVAEIVEAVIRWNPPVTDPRVAILQMDVVEVIRESPAAFDAVLLDVDNGPAALTTDGNERLYSRAGLRLVRAALRPGGCAAFWSAAVDAGFEKRLGQVAFQVEVQRCRSHRIYLCR